MMLTTVISCYKLINKNKLILLVIYYLYLSIIYIVLFIYLLLKIDNK